MAKATRRARRFRGVRPSRRWLGVLVLALVGFLYSRPLVAYLDARNAVAGRSAEVAGLRAEKRALERRVRAQASSKALQREARRLAYVKPGERLFIVTGIAAWRRDRARDRARAAATLGRGG